MRLKLKDEEKLVVTKYMEKIYNHTLNFIETGIDVPDCYFKFGRNYYAVEVTRYFQQNSEQKHIIYVKYIEKLLKNEDFFKEVHNRLGKRQEENITVAFYKFEEMNNLIINNITLIKQVSVGNSYFFNDEGLVYNKVLILDNSCEEMHIKDFLNNVKKDILNEKCIDLEIFTKNKYNISIRFKFCKKPYFGKKGHKKVSDVFCWTEQKDELYNNIIGAIEKKNKKLIKEYYKKLDRNKIHYDYYNLVIYAEGFDAKLNEDELYRKVKEIEDLQYDEIVIFLWKKIMIINKEGFYILNN